MQVVYSSIDVQQCLCYKINTHVELTMLFLQGCSVAIPDSDYIMSIPLLEAWDRIFACANTWHYGKAEQQAIIDAVVIFRFAMASQHMHTAKSKKITCTLGPEDIRKIIDLCQQQRPYKLNKAQASRLLKILRILDTLSSVKESSNTAQHGVTIKNFFWGDSSPENDFKRGMYTNVVKIFECIAPSLDEADTSIIADFSIAKNLITTIADSSTIEALEKFQYEEGFINLTLRTIHLACVYIIDNPDPTIFHDKQSKVAAFLIFANDLMLKYKHLNPTRRTIELLTFLNHLDDSTGVFSSIITDLNDEFFNGNDTVRKIGGDSKLKANWQFNYFKEGLSITPRVADEKIIEKRNKIPFELVERHLKKNPTHTNFLVKFINWIFNSIFNRLEYAAYAEFSNFGKKPVERYLLEKNPRLFFEVPAIVYKEDEDDADDEKNVFFDVSHI